MGSNDSKDMGLRGFVCGSDKKPFPDAVLLLNFRKIPIKDDGTFFIPQESLRREFKPLFLMVKGETNGKKLASAKWIEYVTGRENITIRLYWSATIFGRVMTPGDKPVNGAKVSALINVKGMTCHGTFPVGESALTDESGQFALSGLYPDSTYKLRVECPGKERKMTDWISVGNRELNPDFKVILRDAPGFISGCVADEKGNPLANKRVILGNTCNPDAVCVTDSQGRFRIEDLIPGEEVEISVKGASKKVRVGTENLVIEVKNKKQ